MSRNVKPMFSENTVGVHRKCLSMWTDISHLAGESLKCL
jgi:hypothetical protein